MIGLILQISIFYLFSLILSSVISNRYLKSTFLIIFSIILTAEFNSIILGGTLIDYKFYQHLNFETVWAVKSIFFSQSLKILCFGLGICYSLFFLSKMNLLNRISFKIKLLVTIILFSLMCVNDGILFKLYEIISLKNATVNNNFEQNLMTIGGKKDSYVSSKNLIIDQIEDTINPKNIIVISMESLEKAYLSDNFSNLTPNLRHMSKNMTYFNMEMGEGSDWTAGSIYTELTGFPCIFKKQGNQIFQGVSETRISGIGHILEKAGYDLTYALASADFAGIRDMLKVNKFNVKSDKDFSPKSKFLDWGTSDKDLFREVKEIIKNKKKKDKPFAVFMSTISTHPPDGVYDARMEKLIKKQKTNLEFMVAATDYHIGELMKFLKKEDLIDNTVIYLFPDHLLMGTESDVINRFPSKRSLFLLTNAPKKNFTYDITKTIYQIDIPKIILEGAGIKHNAKFFTDLIKNQDKLTYIKNHKSEILSINESSLIFKNSFITTNNSLKYGDRLYSPNKRFSLVINDDGNCVIYDNLTKPIWNSNTGGTKVTSVFLDRNGNLTLKDKSNKIHWSSNSTGDKDSYLILQDDGNLVIYSQNKPIWASNSVQE